MASGRGGFIISTAGVTQRELNVPSGKDVLNEILSFCRQGFGVRVLRAEGAVSTCTLKQPGSSIAAPYTGDFLIGLLRGVFLPPIEEGSEGEMITNGLEISLRYKTRKSWRKIEGTISDRLTVARQVVVTLYVFKVDGEKLKKRLDEVGKDAVLDEVVDAPPTRKFKKVGPAPEPTSSTSNSRVVVRSRDEILKAHDVKVIFVEVPSKPGEMPKRLKFNQIINPPGNDQLSVITRKGNQTTPA